MIAVHGVLHIIFWALAIAAFAFEVFALVHAIRTPANSFVAAGKQTKNLWLIILGLATLFGFSAAVQFLEPLNIFTIVAFIAAAIYLADVRPAVSGSRGGSSQGPYGPW
ncbi:DUF2516 family protein [Bailinhaonella thermotolerans]|uniref:DUF2516 family protein n=1 Tax=Bailinhaonella thermotolerans TaxID=1070861 RepID=A0A3A4B9I0_9ACTN|nr:DUF2516 family protein [Bailinhaonella thermotolerans]RJL30838.1 DUF2516 family protein [Bailinhaonella thermotolerans]